MNTKVTKGFVYVNDDGEYLYYYRASSHTGTRFISGFTKDILAATIVSNEHLLDIPYAERASLVHNLKMVPVTITRTIELHV